MKHHKWKIIHKGISYMHIYNHYIWIVTLNALVIEYFDRAFYTRSFLQLYNSVLIDPILLYFGMGSLIWLIHLHNKFQLLALSPLSDTGGNSWFIIMRKSIAQFLPRLSLASYLCLLVLDSFLTTKRHPSDVQPNYIPISSSSQ